ncbi:hypothetical protein QFC20_007657 [Naganishia adeliensis]|uniref:Uncharacterized protein n=1 Tax=Naganishia adeliensis TaxID=92952 RepID=A0ACC2UX95_9TREE|nr:hypothetical protein QFC20_007657 [Naganishia adeliensis]
MSATSLANVMAILNAHALAAQSKDSLTSSQSDSVKHQSTSKNRVVIPVERTEVVAISNKDAAYSPARIGLNRLPFSSSKSTLSSDPSMTEKVQGTDLY